MKIAFTPLEIYETAYRNLLIGNFDRSWEQQMSWLDLLWDLMEPEEHFKAWVFVDKFNKEFLNERS